MGLRGSDGYDGSSGFPTVFVISRCLIYVGKGREYRGKVDGHPTPLILLVACSTLFAIPLSSEAQVMYGFELDGLVYSVKER